MIQVIRGFVLALQIVQSRYPSSIQFIQISPRELFRWCAIILIWAWFCAIRICLLVFVLLNLLFLFSIASHFLIPWLIRNILFITCDPDWIIQPLLVTNLEMFWGTFVFRKCFGETCIENLVKFEKIEPSTLNKNWYQSWVIVRMNGSGDSISEVFQLRTLKSQILQYHGDLKTKDYDGTTLMSLNMLYLVISLSLMRSLVPPSSLGISS